LTTERERLRNPVGALGGHPPGGAVPLGPGTL